VEELVSRKLLERRPSTADQRKMSLGISPAGKRLGLEALRSCFAIG
jgi:hypothetical protein